MGKRVKTIETYQAGNGQHGWRLRAANGNIVASGGEQFARGHTAALRAASHALDLVAGDTNPHPRKPFTHILRRVAAHA